MKIFPSRAVGLIACETLLFSLVLFSVLQLSDAEAAFNDSVWNEKHCDQLTSDIANLRQMSSIANEHQTGEDLTNSQIIRVAADCGMTENQVTSIQRMSPLKIDQTDYQREDIAVNFRSVSMKQVIQFALAMEQLRGSSKATQIGLRHQSSNGRSGASGTPSSEPPEQWNVELILTQLVFVATRTTK